jgi:hypothetical protein
LKDPLVLPFKKNEYHEKYSKENEKSHGETFLKYRDRGGLNQLLSRRNDYCLSPEEYISGDGSFIDSDKGL